MKSSFLFFMILGALTTSQVFGQTKKAKPVKKTAAPAHAPAQKKSTVVPATTTTVTEATPAEAKSSFDKFYERLGISYYGVFTSPPLDNWNSNNASLSPQWSSNDGKGGGGYSPCKNCDTYSMNLWNQVNFAYNFGAKMKFNVIPRFTIFFDTPSDQPKGQRGAVLLEDMLIGFSGVVYTSSDSKFNLWLRPGVRLPTSIASRNGNNAEFGRITHQPELTGSATYDFSPKFQMGLSFQDRFWIYEDRYNNSRNRIYLGPNVTYTVNDTTKIVGYYENIWENNKRYESINGKKPVYYNVWQNAYVGVAKDITPKLNVYPFLSAYVNDVPFSSKSMWIGMWISYLIK